MQTGSHEEESPAASMKAICKFIFHPEELRMFIDII